MIDGVETESKLARFGRIAHLGPVSDALDRFVIVRVELCVVKLIERRSLRAGEARREQRGGAKLLPTDENLELGGSRVVGILQHLIEQLGRTIVSKDISQPRRDGVDLLQATALLAWGRAT